MFTRLRSMCKVRNTELRNMGKHANPCLQAPCSSHFIFHRRWFKLACTWDVCASPQAFEGMWSRTPECEFRCGVSNAARQMKLAIPLRHLLSFHHKAQQDRTETRNLTNISRNVFGEHGIRNVRVDLVEIPTLYCSPDIYLNRRFVMLSEFLADSLDWNPLPTQRKTAWKFEDQKAGSFSQHYP